MTTRREFLKQTAATGVGKGHDLIVENAMAPNIPTGGKMEAIG
jgi:hypothetical protein